MTFRRFLVVLSFFVAAAVGAWLGAWFMVDWFEDSLGGQS